MTHICVSKLTIIGSDNGLSPDRHQAIIWTNAGILFIGTLGTNFSDILIEIRIFSFKKMGLKVSSAKWRPFCLGLNVLIQVNCHKATLVTAPSHRLNQCWIITILQNFCNIHMGCRVIVSKINVHSHTYSYVLVANWYHVREWSTLLAFMFRALARPLVACVKMATSSIVRCRQ